MAGDWIKAETNLAEKAEVIGMAKLLGLPKDYVVGLCIRFWGWADRQTADGWIPFVTSSDVDDVVQHRGFGQALVQVDWLADQDGGIIIPNYDRHNGESAKKRAMKSERQRRWRANRDVDAGAST